MPPEESSDPASNFTSLMERIDSVCDRFVLAWKQGLPPRIEEYLFEFQGPERVVLFRHLLEAELDLRNNRGERPAQEDYVARFPDYRSLIESLIQACRKN